MLQNVLFLAVCLDIAVVCAIVRKRHQAAFKERFPLISDAEFMALCAPGTDPWVALTVRRTLAEALAVDYERIYPSSRIIADLGAE